MPKKVISFITRDDQGNETNHGFIHGDSIDPNRILIDGSETSQFMVIDSSFMSVFKIMQAAGQDIKVVSDKPLSVTGQTPLFTESGNESIPLGMVEGDFEPEINAMLFVMGNVDTEENPVRKGMNKYTYSNIQLVGEIVAIDAR